RVGLERYSYSLKVAPELPLAAVPHLPLAEVRRSLVTQPTRAVVPSAIGEQDLDLYLAVPPAVKGAAWFKAWGDEVGVRPETDGRLELDAKVRGLFAEKFKATLKNTFSQKDTLAAFLGTDRKGHCEYFATATALLLRTLGVPSRIVVGYRSGHYNDLIDM